MSYAICSVKMGTHVAVCMKGLKPVLANIGLQMLSVDSLRKKIYINILILVIDIKNTSIRYTQFITSVACALGLTPQKLNGKGTGCCIRYLFYGLVLRRAICW